MARVVDELVSVFRFKAPGKKQLKEVREEQQKVNRETSQFKARVKTASAAGRRAFARLGSAARRVGRGIAGLGKRLIAMRGQLALIGAGVAAVGFAVKKSIDGVAEFGDTVAKTSKQLGVASDDYQRLSFAAQRSGASTKDLDTSVRTLNKNLVLAQQKGSGPLVDAFNDLGISADQLEGKSLEGKIGLIGDSLQKVSDPATRSALAFEIFGRSGTKLLPLLDEGSVGIKALGDRAGELGIVLGGDALRASESYQDAQLDLKETFKGVVNTVGGALIPAFTDSTNALTGFLAENREAIASGIVEFFEKFTGAIAFLGQVFGRIIEILEPFYMGMQDAYERLFPVFEDTVLNVFETIESSLEALGDAFSIFFDDTDGGFDSLVSDTFDKFVKSIEKIFHRVSRVFIFLEMQIRSVVKAFKLFKSGKIKEGFIELGNLILNALLEPLREVTRSIIDIADSLGASGIVPQAVRDFAKGGTEEIRLKRANEREEKKREEEEKKAAEKREKEMQRELERQMKAFSRSVANEFVGPIAPKRPRFPRRPRKKKPPREGAAASLKSASPLGSLGQLGPTTASIVEGDVGEPTAAGLIEASGVEGRIGRGNVPPILVQNFQNQIQVGAPSVTIEGTFNATTSQVADTLRLTFDDLMNKAVQHAFDSIRSPVRL